MFKNTEGARLIFRIKNEAAVRRVRVNTGEHGAVSGAEISLIPLHLAIILYFLISCFCIQCPFFIHFFKCSVGFFLLIQIFFPHLILFCSLASVNYINSSINKHKYLYAQFVVYK